MRDNIYHHTDAEKSSEGLPEVKKKKNVKKRMTLKLGMWPLYGSSVAGDALTTHRLPVSPLAHRKCRRVRHLCYVETHNSCDPSVRSGQRKGGALLVELSPSLRASPQDGRLFPTTKDWNVSKDWNLGKPPYLFSLSFPHSDILACGSSLALLVFLLVVVS